MIVMYATRFSNHRAKIVINMTLKIANLKNLFECILYESDYKLFLMG